MCSVRLKGIVRIRCPGANTETFLQGLRDLGWIEGKNIAIEYR